MKQLETIEEDKILSLLHFYSEIGVEFMVNNTQKVVKIANAEENKIKSNLKSNNSTNNLIINEEKKAYEKSLAAKSIKELETLFRNYEGCRLKKNATNFIEFQGNINSDILIVDGTPDPEEDKAGKSFVSKKGKLFDNILNAIELERNDIFIANGIPWRPPGNRYPTDEEIKTCRPFIFNLIKLLKPKIIVCLGEVSTKQILDLNQSIINSRGQWYPLKSNSMSSIYEIDDNINVLPTLGISYLLMRPDMKREVWEDMKLLRNKIKETIKK